MPPQEHPEERSVVVLGAGISGLYAAQLLKPRFPDLLVLEAQDRIGGRIKQVASLAFQGTDYSIIHSGATKQWLLPGSSCMHKGFHAS